MHDSTNTCEGIKAEKRFNLIENPAFPHCQWRQPCHHEKVITGDISKRQVYCLNLEGFSTA